MFGIGMTELVVIFVIGLLVLGPKRLPELARSLGRSLAEFRRASTDLRREFMNVAEDVKIEPPSLDDPSPSEDGAAVAGGVPATGSPKPPPQDEDDTTHRDEATPRREADASPPAKPTEPPRDG